MSCLAINSVSQLIMPLYNLIASMSAMILDVHNTTPTDDFIMSTTIIMRKMVTNMNTQRET